MLSGSPDRGIPVIRLTLERMELSILQAFSQMQTQMDVDIQLAVAAYCEPDNIKRVVADAVKTALDRQIRQEVEDFYRRGRGQQTIRKAVIDQLTPYEPPV